jgi:hydrogenase/urease accessory protein HupE
MVPVNAEAHTALQAMGSFWAGVTHSLTSLDQLCFLVGLAIWTRFYAPSLDARVIAAVFGAAIVGVFAAAPFAAR